jgi:hypothetical protein
LSRSSDSSLCSAESHSLPRPAGGSLRLDPARNCSRA